jgi:hypothetical protein
LKDRKGSDKERRMEKLRAKKEFRKNRREGGNHKKSRRKGGKGEK